MPMLVITLTSVPNSLRGDLTKWLQEISTGVYVGNINARVRDELWKRITNNIKQGQATMSFPKRNEIGYDFVVFNTKRKVIDCDGIPLVFLPKETSSDYVQKLGYSNAAKHQKAKRISQSRKKKELASEGNDVVIDIETTGINLGSNYIIEIAAMKKVNGETILFHELVKIEKKLPKEIKELTGITDDMLARKGKKIEVVLENLQEFVGNAILVGYNIKFDVSFINNELKRSDGDRLQNKTVCLMNEVKREKKFLRDYKLSTVLKEYKIDAMNLHRAHNDVKAEYELATKLNIFVSGTNANDSNIGIN